MASILIVIVVLLVLSLATRAMSRRGRRIGRGVNDPNYYGPTGAPDRGRQGEAHHGGGHDAGSAGHGGGFGDGGHGGGVGGGHGG